MRQLADEADVLAEQHGAGAFFALFSRVIKVGAAHRGLAEALAGTGFDMEAAAEQAGHGVSVRLRDLLGTAQQAGVVRADVTYTDVKALMMGCLGRATDDTDPGALDRVITVVCDGLRPRNPGNG
jgi:hypothetical protein